MTRPPWWTPPWRTRPHDGEPRCAAEGIAQLIWRYRRGVMLIYIALAVTGNLLIYFYTR